MADAKMNQKWWTSNKAKTLSDSGDTVSKALAVWDAVKAAKEGEKAEAALAKLKAAAAALKGKANKTIHKETIAYLATYESNCTEGIALLKKADGQGIFKNFANLPSPIVAHLKKEDPKFWVWFGDSVDFNTQMKSGTGSQKIFDEFCKKGAKREVNLPDAQIKALKAAADAGEWKGEPWNNAVATIKKMMNAQKQNALPTCETVEKQMTLANLANL